MKFINHVHHTGSQMQQKKKIFDFFIFFYFYFEIFLKSNATKKNLSLGPHLVESVGNDADYLLFGVGGKMQPGGRTGARTQPGKHPLRQVQPVGDGQQHQTGLLQGRPLEEGVENLLLFAFQLIYFIQYQYPETNKII